MGQHLGATQLTVSGIITHLHVRAINPSSSRGVLVIGGLHFACLLGKNGRTHRKREGDGKSPVGRWKLGQLYYRSDKMGHVKGARSLKPGDGWCDATGHGRYNRPVSLPFAASHEGMWRKDEAYDLVCLTDHNQRPRIQGLGSAIFFHLWREGASGTEGCIALAEADFRKVLTLIKGTAYLVI
jgi:L,D-peptidoglycan transpeptidase YkuD (ErfK/YbiS/YcfS/YnhG family)